MSQTPGPEGVWHGWAGPMCAASTWGWRSLSPKSRGNAQCHGGTSTRAAPHALQPAEVPGAQCCVAQPGTLLVGVSGEALAHSRHPPPCFAPLTGLSGGGSWDTSAGSASLLQGEPGRASEQRLEGPDVCPLPTRSAAAGPLDTPLGWGCSAPPPGHELSVTWGQGCKISPGKIPSAPEN